MKSDSNIAWLVSAEWVNFHQSLGATSWACVYTLALSAVVWKSKGSRLV